VVLNHLLKVVDVIVLHPFDSKVVEVLIIGDISESPFPNPKLNKKDGETKDVHPCLPERSVVLN